MIDRWRKLLLCLGITPNYKGFHFLLTWNCFKTTRWLYFR
jgi:hypothetical protein